MKKYLLVIIMLLIGLAVFPQPKYLTLPGYAMKALDMTDSSGFELRDVPITTSRLDNSLCENNFQVEPENLYGTYLPCFYSGYRGQRPVFAHQTVTSRDGEVLFYIVDNFIYNKYGDGFRKDNSGAYWTLNEEYNPYRPDGLANNHLYNKIIVVPKPGYCSNSFYIIYTFLHVEWTHGGLFYPDIFIQELEYTDDSTISISPPAELVHRSIYQPGCDDCSSISMDITSYDERYGDYLLVLTWVDKLFIYRISDNLEEIKNNYIYYEFEQYISGGKEGNDHCLGAKRASSVLTKDNSGNILYLANRNFQINGVNQPALLYFRFSRNFAALTQNNIFCNYTAYYKSREIINERDNIYRNICGMERSPDSRYLYTTFSELDSIYYFDIEDFLNGGDYIPPDYTGLSIPGNFRHSELKLLRNKIYAVDHYDRINKTGRLVVINDPDVPGSGYSYFPGVNNLKRSNLINLLAESELNSEWGRRYIFPHTYDSDYEYMYPPAYRNIHDWNDVADSWSPGTDNNPFGSAGGKISVRGDLIIPTGKHITINNMTLHFSKYRKMIIEQGASVTFNNCLLTSGEGYCKEDDLWQGIVVLGNAGVAQSYGTHGVAYLNSGTIIENAQMAIESKDGGIVKLYNTCLKNNVYGVYFKPYQESHSMSMLRNSEFITDKMFENENIYPRAHIYLDNVKGAKIYGNSFKNTVAAFPPFLNIPYTPSRRGTGIKTYYSSFATHMATFWDSESGLGNRFEGLHYGIYAYGNSSNAVSIRYNNFTNNYRGIYLNSVDAPIVAFNNITVSTSTYPIEVPVPNQQGLPDDGVRYGAYLHACRNFKFEKNTIKKGDAGLYVYNSGNAEGYEIYRNQFGDENEGINAASIILGKNSDFIQNNPSYIGDIGLQVRCNKYIANTHAISVLNGNMRKNQGENSDQTNKLAGNQFHKTLENAKEFTVQVSGDYSHFDLGTNVKYNYYQHDDRNAPASDLFYRELNPGKITVEKINPRTMYNTQFNTSSSCQTTFISSGASGVSNVELNPSYEFPVKLSKISGLNDDLGKLESGYHSIVDKGDTELMLKTAKSMDHGNYEKACEELSNSGYLSDEVYAAVIENTTAPESAKAAVLINNSPLPVKIITVLENAVMDKELKSMVMSYQEGVNPREQLEYQMSDIKHEIAGEESGMVHILMNQEEFPEKYADILINYFSGKKDKTYTTYQDIYSLELSKGDKAAALETIKEMEIFSESLDTELADEIKTYCEISSIYVNSLDKGSPDTLALAPHKERLLEASLSGSWLYSAQAQALYTYLTNTRFHEPTPLPEDIPSERKTQVKTDISGLFKPVLKIYPNPTKGQLHIEYDLGRNYEPGYGLLFEAIGKQYNENCSGGILNIYTPEGKLLLSYRLTGDKGVKEINIGLLPKGMYMLEVTDCYGNLASGKINKQ